MMPSLKAKLQDPSFFLRMPLLVGRDLLGMVLVTEIAGVSRGGMIVEVEAYSGQPEFGDEASHCFFNRTPRNEVMFHTGGHAYVYFIYGMHFCVNVVTEGEGIGSAVLIRALEVVEGIDAIRPLRPAGTPEHRLLSGPGTLCRGLGIDRTFNGEDFMTSSRIGIEQYRSFPDDEVVYGPRIGITRATELAWRMFMRSNRAVSSTRSSGPTARRSAKHRG